MLRACLLDLVADWLCGEAECMCLGGCCCCTHFHTSTLPCRYTSVGKLEGETEVNLKLPPLTEMEKVVEWSARDAHKAARLEEMISGQLEVYLHKVRMYSGTLRHVPA